MVYEGLGYSSKRWSSWSDGFDDDSQAVVHLVGGMRDRRVGREIRWGGLWYSLLTLACLSVVLVGRVVYFYCIERFGNDLQ